MSDKVKNKGGRPKKTGLIYFPLFHDLFDHPKLRAAEDLVDPTGQNNRDRLLVDKILIRFYSAIFKKGYYMVWDDEQELEMCRTIGNGMNHLWLKPYLNAMLEVNFLSKEKFEQHGVLTSRGLQEKWLSISKQIKRDKPTIIPEYFIPEDNKPEFLPEQTGVSSGTNISNHKNKPKNTATKTESTVPKESKTEFLPEETTESSSINQDIYPNQGGVSPSTTTILKNIGNSIQVVVEGKVPEQTGVSSGRNANNSGNIPEEIYLPPIILPNEPEFLPEETIFNSGRNHTIKEIPSTSLALFDIDLCAANYLLPKHLKTKDQHLIQLGVMWDDSTVIRWLAAFNRSKLSDGISEQQYNGTNGYVRNFKNWAQHQLSINGKDVNPDILYTENDVKNGNKQSAGKFNGTNPVSGTGTGSKTGTVSNEQIKRVLDSKANARNNQSPTT